MVRNKLNQIGALAMLIQLERPGNPGRRASWNGGHDISSCGKKLQHGHGTIHLQTFERNTLTGKVLKRRLNAINGHRILLLRHPVHPSPSSD
jgi:hypothetical protein